VHRTTTHTRSTPLKNDASLAFVHFIVPFLKSPWSCSSSVFGFLPGKRFFDNRTHLFHEIEYAHIVVFYLGVGLIFQVRKSRLSLTSVSDSLGFSSLTLFSPLDRAHP
jgi:hypothetical protein